MSIVEDIGMYDSGQQDLIQCLYNKTQKCFFENCVWFSVTLKKGLKRSKLGTLWKKAFMAFWMEAWKFKGTSNNGTGTGTSLFQVFIQLLIPVPVLVVENKI